MHGGARTFVQEAQRGVERAVEVLEEQRLAVQRVDRDVLSAVGAVCQYAVCSFQHRARSTSRL